MKRSILREIIFAVVVVAVALLNNIAFGFELSENTIVIPYVCLLFTNLI